MKKKSTQLFEYLKTSFLQGILQPFQKLTLLLFISLLAFQLQANTFAQNVKGRITDDTGAGIPGVNVAEKGTSNGTTTNADGQFSLSVKDGNSVLVFTAVGLAPNAKMSIFF